MSRFERSVGMSVFLALFVAAPNVTARSDDREAEVEKLLARIDRKIQATHEQLIEEIRAMIADALARAPAPAAPVAEVLGVWDMQSELGDTAIEAVMTLRSADAGKIAGQWSSMGREMPLLDIRLEGNRLRFRRAVGDQELTFDGELAGDRITGRWDGAFGEVPVRGQRQHGVTRSGPLDGQSRSFVVVGYSTSYAWPQMLQEMLDDHASGRVYHILNAVVGGAPVEHWIEDVGGRNYERTIAQMVRDFFGDSPRLRGRAPVPTVAICQQSLQFTGDRRGPVKTTDDMVGAERGADALEKMALRLRGLGLEQVWIAMHIYKEPVEPEVGNERIALRRLLGRGHDFLREGPDLWETTKEEFPRCFEEDRLHPNERGMKLMAEGWYRALAGDAARDDVVKRMHERSYDVERMMRDYLSWRRGETQRRVY